MDSQEGTTAAPAATATSTTTAATKPAAAGETRILTADEGVSRADVSATTIGRMMGLATVNDLRLLESKLDLASTKITTLTVRFDKILTTLQSMPNGSDMERIDVQLGAVKTILTDIATQLGAGSAAKKNDPGANRVTAKAKIFTSSAEAPAETPAEPAATPPVEPAK